jgi:uncharacterized protein YjeT (DUF2065 family)
VTYDILRALALLLVIEGILPFVAPAGFRLMLQRVSQADERSLRLAGLVAMIAGLLLLQLVRWAL